VLYRVPPPSLSTAAIRRVGLGLALVCLAACTSQDRPVADAEGQLFARALDEIGELYLEPVSSRRLALAGATRLARLDSKITVGDSLGTRFGDALTLSYDSKDIAFYAVPSEKDSRQWGELLATMIATAKQASPELAALPQETIQTAVFSGMTTALDRFSHYSAPEVARDQRAERDGFGGIGVTLDTTSDNFRVTAITPQGPADRAGIRPEDQIVAIDGVATAGCPHEDIVHKLRGPIGSAIAVRVLHPGTAQPRDLHLRRAHVILPTVTMSRVGNIAVFRITSFNHSTTARIASGLAEAERQAGGKLAGIVLDLRSNPGGLLDQAVSLADLFIRDGPIVGTVGRHPAAKQYFGAAGDAVAPQLPVVVLINGGSASASEIVAAALQDRGRGVVIGSSSYGKGTVQTVLRLPNDGELIVTWARLVTPNGYLLQTHGVVPTLCTADLGDDEHALDVGLQRAGATAPDAARARAALDDPAWAALRQSCPPRHATPTIDLKLAERILADPKLYAEALYTLPATARLAENAPVADAAPALTGAEHGISSHHTH
jgi:carboxyl-terminal processing protease